MLRTFQCLRLAVVHATEKFEAFRENVREFIKTPDIDEVTKYSDELFVTINAMHDLAIGNAHFYDEFDLGLPAKSLKFRSAFI